MHAKEPTAQLHTYCHCFPVLATPANVSAVQQIPQMLFHVIQFPLLLTLQTALRIKPG